ncbi:Omp28-related outer membrane protein [bacterium]|nr:Omp28-related outer membrane protein [bacterium]
MSRIIRHALLALLIAAPALAFASAPRVPLGILVTNWDCAPCAPANQALDAWYPTVGDRFALIRVHCWWPGPDDPIYRDNVPQSRYLIWDTPNGPDSAPHLWVDNVVNGGTYADGMVGFLEDRARVPAPLALDLAWDDAAEQVTATIDVVAELDATDHRLFVAVTEDSVAAEGANGEPYHNQAFRRLYPDTLGVPVATEPGEQVRTVVVPLDGAWQRDQLRVTAYVQDRATGEVQNAATLRLADTATAAPSVPGPTLTVRAYPSPFNPQTRIRFELPAAGPVDVRVHDLAGRVVRTLVDGARRPAGTHEVVWRGRDDRGRALSSGVYLVRVRAGGEIGWGKVVLAK